MTEQYPSIETIVDILEKVNINDEKKLEKKQIKELTPFLSLKDTNSILQVLDMIRIDGYELTINSLKKDKKNFFKNSSFYISHQNQEIKDIENLYRKKKVYNSNYKCPRCSSNNVREVNKQTRSSDEGGTSFKQCQNCFTTF